MGRKETIARKKLQKQENAEREESDYQQALIWLRSGMEFYWEKSIVGLAYVRDYQMRIPSRTVTRLEREKLIFNSGGVYRLSSPEEYAAREKSRNVARKENRVAWIEHFQNEIRRLAAKEHIEESEIIALIEWGGIHSLDDPYTA